MSTKIVVTMENAVAEGRKQVEAEFEKLRESADATDKQIIAGGRKVRSVLAEENKNAVRDKKAADNEQRASANRLLEELIKGNKEADATRAKFDELAAEGQKQRAAEAKKTLSLITKAERNAVEQRAADERQAIKEIEAEERAAGERRIARQKSIRERMRANSKKFDQENAAAIKAEESRRTRGVSRREEISAGFKNARNAGAADRLSEIRGSELSAVKQRGADRQAEIRASLEVSRATQEEAKQAARLAVQTQNKINATRSDIRATQERTRKLQEMEQAGEDVSKELQTSIRLEVNQTAALNRLNGELAEYSGRLDKAKKELEDIQYWMDGSERASGEGRKLAKTLEDIGVASDNLRGSKVKGYTDQVKADFEDLNASIKNKGADRQAEIRASLDVANATREEAKQSAALVRQTQESIKTTKAGLRTTRERIRDLQEMKLAGLDVDAQLSASMRLEENQITTMDRLGAELDHYSGRLGTARAKLSDLVDGLSDAERASPGGRRLAKALEDVGVATDRIDAKGLKADADQMQDEFKQTQKTASDAAREIRELQRTLSGQIANVSGLNSQSGQITNQISEVRTLKENLEAVRKPTYQQKEEVNRLTEQLTLLEEELHEVNLEMRQQQGVARKYEKDAQAALKSARSHGVLDNEVRNLNQSQRLLQNRLRQADLAIEGNRARETAVKYGLFRRSILGVGDGLKKNKKVLIDAAQAWLLNTRASNEFFNSVQRGDKGGAGPASFGAIISIGLAAAIAGSFQASRKALEELADAGDAAAKGKLKELNYTLDSTSATLKRYAAEMAAGAEETGWLGWTIKGLAKVAEDAQKLLRDAAAADQLGLKDSDDVLDRLMQTAQTGLYGISYAVSGSDSALTRFFGDLLIRSGEAQKSNDKLIAQQVRMNLIAENSKRINGQVRDARRSAFEAEIKQNAARMESLTEISRRMRELQGAVGETTDVEAVRDIEVELVALAEREAEIRMQSGEARLSLEKQILGIRRQGEKDLQGPLALPGGGQATLDATDAEIRTAQQLGQEEKVIELRARKAQELAGLMADVQAAYDAQNQALDELAAKDKERKDRQGELTKAIQDGRQLIVSAQGPSAETRDSERKLQAVKTELALVFKLKEDLKELGKLRAAGQDTDQEGPLDVAKMYLTWSDPEKEATAVRDRIAATLSSLRDVSGNEGLNALDAVKSEDSLKDRITVQRGVVQDSKARDQSVRDRLTAEIKSLEEKISQLEEEGKDGPQSDARKQLVEELDARRQQRDEINKQYEALKAEQREASRQRITQIELEKRKTLELLNLQSQTPQQKFNAISQLDDIDRERNLLSNGGSKLSQNRLDSKFGEQLKKETEKAADNVERIAKEMQELERKGKAGTEEMERLRKEMEQAVEAAKILNAEKAKFDTGSIAKVQNQQVQSFSERVAAIENYLSRQTEQTGQNLTGQLRGRIDDNTVNREIRSRRDADFQSKLGDVQKELEEKGIATKTDRNGNLIATDRSNQRQVRNAVNAARKDVYGKPVTNEERETVRNELAQRLVDTLQESGQINKETAEALRKGLETQTELIASEVALTQSVKDLTAALNGKGKAPGEKKSKDVLTPEVAKIKGEQAEALNPKNPEGYTKKGPVLFADDLTPKFDGDVEGPRPDAQPGFPNRLDDKPQPGFINRIEAQPHQSANWGGSTPGGSPDVTDAQSGFQELSGAMGGNAQAVGGLLSAISQGLPQIAQAVVQQSVAVTNNAAMIGQIVEWMNSNMARSADPGKSAAGRGRG